MVTVEHDHWRSDVLANDEEIARLLAQSSIDVHSRFKDHLDVKAKLGEDVFEQLTALLRPTFPVTRKALVVSAIMGWQKKVSNKNMHKLYANGSLFRSLRAGRLGRDLHALSRKFNIGVTELGMALIGGIFSKYFCMTPHRLDPTAQIDKHKVVSDQEFLRRMVKHHVRLAQVWKARQRMMLQQQEQEQDGVQALAFQTGMWHLDGDMAFFNNNNGYDDDDDDDDDDEIVDVDDDSDDSDSVESVAASASASSDVSPASSTASSAQSSPRLARKAGCASRGPHTAEGKHKPNANTNVDAKSKSKLRLVLSEEQWLEMVDKDSQLREIALAGSLCIDGVRYYSQTDHDNRMTWFRQVERLSKSDKVSAFTFRDAQTKPRQASQAEEQLLHDLREMGITPDMYKVESQLKRTDKTNVATPDVKFNKPVRINGKVVNWIDVKSGLVLPRTSCARLMNDFARKLRKYVEHYNDGIVLLYQTPVGTSMPAWAAKVLGSAEKASSVTFLTRIRAGRGARRKFGIHSVGKQPAQASRGHARKNGHVAEARDLTSLSWFPNNNNTTTNNTNSSASHGSYDGNAMQHFFARGNVASRDTGLLPTPPSSQESSPRLTRRSSRPKFASFASCESQPRPFARATQLPASPKALHKRSSSAVQDCHYRSAGADDEASPDVYVPPHRRSH